MKIFILFFALCILQRSDAAPKSYLVYWAAASNGTIPVDAILSGNDSGGVPLYTCRAWYNSDLVPGKLTAVNGGCNIAYNGKEVKITNYDVAVGAGIFVTSVSNYLSYNYVEGGIVTSKNKTLYICRATIDGNLSVGKLEDNKCWIGYGGGQYSFSSDQYAVLTDQVIYVLIPI